MMLISYALTSLAFEKFQTVLYLFLTARLTDRCLCESYSDFGY